MLEPKHPAQAPLTSWKEIAAHFERDVRTVQRWERDEGLPVHRHLHHHQASVYAYVEELDSWWKARDGSTARATCEACGSAAERQHAARGSAVPAAVATLPPRIVRGTAVAFVLAAALMTGWSGRPARGTSAAPSLASSDPREIARYWMNDPPDLLVPASVGDLNRDGRDDVVFSALRPREVYVLFGADQYPAGALQDAAGLRITGRHNGHLTAFGPGDVNADGIDDLVVTVLLGEPDTYERTGPTYLLFGRARWPSELSLPEGADVTLAADVGKDIRLSTCSEVVDVNGDGVADLVLGGGDHSPAGRVSAGAAFVLFGRRQWPTRLDVVRQADVTIAGARKGEGLGPACAAGDWNGDGLADLALLATESQLWNLLGGRGRTYLFAGRATWPARLDAQTDFTWRIDGTVNSALHSAPTMADVDGDGKRDLILAMSGSPEAPLVGGRVMIWFASAGRTGVARDSDADVTIVDAPRTDARFGADVLAQDIDLDGIDDLLIAEPASGRIHLFYGRRRWKARGTAAEMGGVTIGAPNAGRGGSGLALADVDGDSLPELIATSVVRDRASPSRAAHAWMTRPYDALSIDVRPGSHPNVIVYPGGTLAVRLRLVNPAAGEIDPATLYAAGARPTDHVWRDFDRTGREELQVYFDTRTMHLEATTDALVMTGRTRDGQPLAGADTVVVHRAASATTPAVKPASSVRVPR